MCIFPGLLPWLQQVCIISLLIPLGLDDSSNFFNLGAGWRIQSLWLPSLPSSEQPSHPHKYSNAPFGLCTAVFTSTNLEISRLPTPSCFLLPGSFAGFQTSEGYKYYVYAHSELDSSSLTWVIPTAGMVHPIHPGLSLIRVLGGDCPYEWVRTSDSEVDKEAEVKRQDNQVFRSQLDQMRNRMQSGLKIHSDPVC
jgi:hypothetical protein